MPTRPRPCRTHPYPSCPAPPPKGHRPCHSCSVQRTFVKEAEADVSPNQSRPSKRRSFLSFSLSFSSVRDLEQPVRLTRSTRLFMLSNILFFNWAHNPTPSRTPVQPDPHIVTPACSTAQAVVALLFGPACHELPLEHAELGLRLLKFAHPGPASPSTQHRPPRVPAPRAPCCHAAAILLVRRHEGRCPSSQPGQPCPCPAPRA